MKYDKTNKESIISYAKNLVNKTLRDYCDKEEHIKEYSGKGGFGIAVEEIYFGYKANSISQPDFVEAGLELKATPLKEGTKNYLSKERLVLNIINYDNIVKQQFDTSDVWMKNNNLLVICYLHNGSVHFLDYPIKLVGEWMFSEIDKAIIRNDWETIKKKVEEGKAHELSEGDTLYLGACTKGANAQSVRRQPNSHILAKQRAFSLKQGYVNHIIAKIAQRDYNDNKYGRLLNNIEELSSSTLEDVLIGKFKTFYDKPIESIAEKLGVTINSNAKNYLATLSKSIQNLEELSKADVVVKSILLKSDDTIKESMSFKTINYEELVKEEVWEESKFFKLIERRFLLVFYKQENNCKILKKAIFWTMPYIDKIECEKVWLKTKSVVKSGEIVKEIRGSNRYTNFPKKNESEVSHVRPHAKKAEDTSPLPEKDILTGVNSYTKHCFWLNNTYIAKIYRSSEK